jgi:predicted DCC family thiol-disulfide oxidoreductase YuxK
MKNRLMSWQRIMFRPLRGLSTTSTNSPAETNRLFPQQYNVLYDRKCALCRIEIDWMQRKDAGGKILKFTDIEANYDENAPENGGVSYGEAMRVMTIVDGRNGETIKGPTVFYLLYDALGLGFVWRWTTLPIIGTAVNHVYGFWAKYRTNLTRGRSVESLIDDYAAYQKELEECTESGRCSK